MTEGVSSENEDSRRASEDSRSTAFRPSTDAFVNAVFNTRVLLAGEWSVYAGGSQERNSRHT